MKKNIKVQDDTQSLQSCVSDSAECSYWVTAHLRYAKKYIQIDEQTVKWELRLQQMWQGQDGTQKWEWVEVFE